MNLPGQFAFLRALGWALLNSLWQFGLLWMVFMMLINGRKKFTPSVKHGIALFSITAGFIWFGMSLSFQYFIYSEAIDQDAGSSFYTNYIFSVTYQSLKNFLENNLPYLSAAYLVVITVLFVRFFRFFQHSHKIQTKGLTKPRAELRLLVQQLAEHLDICKKVEVWISEYVDTTMIIGFLKPTILLPLASISQLSVKQLESILIHELAHIKRNDYLINLYVATTGIIFFFNPFARLLMGSIKQERENSCDDWVLQFRFDPHLYSSALLSLEQSRSARMLFALEATGKSKKTLLLRIQRIMKVKSSSYHNNGAYLLAYAFSACLLCFIAFVNPGDVVITQLAGNFPALNKYLTTASRESSHYLLSPAPISGVSKKEKRKNPVNKNRKAIAVKPANTLEQSDEENPLAAEMLTNINSLNDHVTQFASSIKTAETNFSIREKSMPDPPPSPEADLPFVPNSSFSYYFGEDTSKPKIKIETYSQHVARTSMVKAQKALDKIDWKVIEKNLKNTGKVDINKLKKEIQVSLEQLNWQQINQEVNKAVNDETTIKMRAAVKIEMNKMKKYKEQQQEYQNIQTELLRREEIYKKGAENKLIEIKSHSGKKRIIVFI